MKVQQHKVLEHIEEHKYIRQMYRMINMKKKTWSPHKGCKVRKNNSEKIQYQDELGNYSYNFDGSYQYFDPNIQPYDHGTSAGESQQESGKGYGDTEDTYYLDTYSVKYSACQTEGHNNLLSCNKFKDYLPEGPSAISLLNLFCAICLNTQFSTDRY